MLCQNSFYITIKIHSLGKYLDNLDIFWPDENDKDYETIIGDHGKWISPKIGNSVSISVRIDMTQIRR